MTKCLFCETDLTDDTKPEHILLNALGGRKSSRRLICSEHNESFGSTIDKVLAEQLPIVRNMLQLDSGTGKKPPMLRNVQAGGEVFNIKNDGKFEWDPEPFKIVELPDGRKDLTIQARSAEHLASLVPHIAAKLKIPEAKLVELMKTTGGTQTYRRPGLVRHSLSFGGPDAVRSMTKACLELWATIVGNEEVKSAPYEVVRSFVLEGSREFLETRTAFDSRKLPGDERLSERFSPHYNLVYARSDSTGRVIGHFTLYNLSAWQIVLAERGGRPCEKVGLISNPLNPAIWSDEVGDEAVTDFEWLTMPQRDGGQRLQEGVSAMLELLQGRSLAREVDRITRSAMEKHGVEELSDLDERVHVSIIKEINDRTARHLAGLPEEKILGAEDIEVMLLQGRKKDSNTK